MIVTSAGRKMGKSLGNSQSLPELFDGSDPRAYRMLAARTRYRSPLEVDEVTLAEAADAVHRIDKVVERADPGWSGGFDPDVIAAFRQAMDDDFNGAAATASIFAAVRSANVAFATGNRKSGNRLAVGLAGCSWHRAAQSLAAACDDARRRRDWPTADQLRTQLAERLDGAGHPRPGRA